MKNLFAARETLLFVLVWAWFGISYLVAAQIPRFVGHMNDAQMELERVSKNILMVFVMILLVTTVKKLRYLVLMTAGCFGLLGVKSAVFGARTSGEQRVWGPPDSFLADNNGFALALNMALPMLFFLAREETNPRIRKLLYVMFGCSVLSVVLTYSRGGLLGLTVVLMMICIRARRKALGFALIFFAALAVLALAPEQWQARMDNFVQGKLDDSAQQRLVSWGTAWRLVQDYPITGAGFDALPDENLFAAYQTAPLPGGFKSSGPHSIYFQLLADQGFVGLFLFLAVIGSCILTLRNIRKKAKWLGAPSWVENYTQMMEVALVGYLVSGTFLGLAYFDFIYQVVGLTICVSLLFRQEVLLPTLTAPPENTHFVVEPESAGVTT
jgi:probable O-glycosylation ligase (exosortase A-associated)